MKAKIFVMLIATILLTEYTIEADKYKISASSVVSYTEYIEESNEIDYSHIREIKITIHQENIVTNEKELIVEENYLLDIEKIDKNYTGESVEIIGKNREYLERLVQGEAGAEGYIGACLVAQAIRDTMILEDNYNVLSIKKEYLYSGKLNTEPNNIVKNAVKFIFDDGGMAVKHRLIFFYAPRLCKSGFHESQNFIVEYKGHRFFDLRD